METTMSDDDLGRILGVYSVESREADAEELEADLIRQIESGASPREIFGEVTPEEVQEALNADDL